MIVYYFNNFHSFYFYPHICAIAICWNGVLVRLKYQPIWLVEVTCPLTLPVSLQVMIVSRQISYVFQGLGITEVPETQQKQIRPFLAESLIAFSLVRCYLLQFLIMKGNVH